MTHELLHASSSDAKEYFPFLCLELTQDTWISWNCTGQLKELHVLSCTFK